MCLGPPVNLIVYGPPTIKPLTSPEFLWNNMKHLPDHPSDCASCASPNRAWAWSASRRR
jgi:hypothetical protein